MKQGTAGNAVGVVGVLWSPSVVEDVVLVLAPLFQCYRNVRSDTEG